MGFFRDLLGPARPCDLCQIGQRKWPRDRNAVADWKIWGGGLHVELLVCAGCKRLIEEQGLSTKIPVVGLAYLAAIGRAPRANPHAYLQHAAWRSVWVHLFEAAQITVNDEFQAAAAIRYLEPSLAGQYADDEGSDERPLLALSELAASDAPPHLISTEYLAEKLTSVALQGTWDLSDLLREASEGSTALERVRSPAGTVAVGAYNNFIVVFVAEQAFPIWAGSVEIKTLGAVRAAMNLMSLAMPGFDAGEAFDEHYRIIRQDYACSEEHGVMLAIQTAAVRMAGPNEIQTLAPILRACMRHFNTLVEPLLGLHRAFIVLPNA